MTKRTALIVGASRGLGLGLAREFTTRGWQVIASARHPDAAHDLVAAACESAGGLTVAQLDTTDAQQLQLLSRRLGGTSLDLLLVNAGISGPKEQTIDNVTAADIAEVMLTNAFAPLRVAQQLLPLVKQGGTVAFMSSYMGSVADNLTGGFDLYRASKAALNSLTRGFVATAAKDRNLHVLTLHPGWVRTDMGGPAAPLSVEQSVRGMADVLETGRVAKHQFLDYTGRELPW
jgi:NAD(P)-dependent dehydrogenase (short-subunit alcohol dehydrogenase family)